MRNFIFRVCVFLAVSGMPSTVFAADGAALWGFWEKLGAAVLNFAIMVYILYRFGKPAVQRALLKRKETIGARMREASRLKEEAEARKDALEREKRDFEESSIQFRKDYDDTTRGEAEKLIEDARSQALRIREDAEKSSEFESRQRREAFERSILSESLDDAGEVIRERLSKDESLRDKLIDEGIASLRMEEGAR